MSKQELQPKSNKAAQFITFYTSRPDKKAKKLLLGYLVGK